MSWSPMGGPVVEAVQVQGYSTPGLCRIDGLSSERDYQRNDEIYGLSGGTVRFKGRKLRTFTIRCLLYTQQDWKDFDFFFPIVAAVPVGKNFGKAWSVSHPLLKIHGISSVVFEKIKGPEQSSDSGEWTLTLECLEFRKPRVEMAKVDAAKATPIDPVDVEIDQNAAYIEKLSQELAL